MNTLTIPNPVRTASPGQAAGNAATTAIPGSGGESDLDFAGLLDAGIARTADPAQSRESLEVTKGTEENVSACHPAALLDTLAAGKANFDFAGLPAVGIGHATDSKPARESVEIAKEADGDERANDPAALFDAAVRATNPDPRQLIAAQIALQPLRTSPVPVIPTGMPATAIAPTTMPVIVRDAALSARLRTEGGKHVPSDQIQTMAATPRAGDSGDVADVGPVATAAQTAAPELAAVPSLNAEPPEHRQDSMSQLVSMGTAPSQAGAPSQSANAASIVAHVENLSRPFGSPAWDDGFSSRVVWMARNDVQSAEIRLNPQELGPIEIKMVVTNDQGTQATASIQFSATHAGTREAIEAALPRLREMLLDSGIALGNTTVDARTAGNTHGSDDSGRPPPGSPHADARADQRTESTGQPHSGNPVRRGSGLVDTFA